MITRLVSILFVVVLIAAAQGQFRGRRRAAPYDAVPDRGNVPVWPVDKQFSPDLFTFVRIKYTSSQPERTSFAWWTDYPDADLNFSYRLHELTALRVNPEPKVIAIEDPELCNYPWAFMSGVGHILLTDREARALRSYLLGGGFLMVDDFWGQAEWDVFYRALKQVFPEREPVDLPRSHPIFHCVYDLPEERPLQSPNMRAAIASLTTGITWEDGHAGGNTREPHFRAVLDDHDRIMVMICHNTDTGDGWEEETADPRFFQVFSANRNYPLGINILFYAMTH